jgi:hypothetical protein
MSEFKDILVHSRHIFEEKSKDTILSLCKQSSENVFGEFNKQIAQINSKIPSLDDAISRSKLNMNKLSLGIQEIKKKQEIIKNTLINETA